MLSSRVYRDSGISGLIKANSTDSTRSAPYGLFSSPVATPLLIPAKKETTALGFVADLAAGGVSGGVSKTVVAPIERVKLLLQTQDSNPRIKSGMNL